MFRSYFASIEPPVSRWGPSLAEREASRRRAKADLDEEVRAVEVDLWLLRHAGVGQELGAMRRLVACINRADAQRTR